MKQAFRAFASELGTPLSREDIDSVLRHRVVSISVTAANAVVFVIASLGEDNLAHLAMWLAGTLLLCLLTLWRSNRVAGRKSTRVSRKAERRVLLFAILLAVPWASLALHTIGFGGAGDPSLVFLVCTGMAAGGTFVLHRTIKAALILFFTIFGSLILAAGMNAEIDTLPVAVYALVYGGLLMHFAATARETARQRDQSVAALSGAVSDLEAAQDRNFSLANIDTVTGLANRKLFQETLVQATASSLSSGEPFCLMLLDLDRFKNVNDLFGHAVGDQLLVLMGQRLRAFAGEAAITARLGGDEFAVILPGLRDAVEIKRRADELISRLNAPAELEGRHIHPGASIGIVVCPDHGKDQDELIRNADLALYAAKDAGRGTSVIFGDGLRAELLLSDAVEVRLRQAIDAADIYMVYQPKVRLADDRLVGAKALVRWQDPHLGAIPPDTFLAVAAERAILPRLSQYIAESVARDVIAWRQAGLDYGKVALSLHPVELKSPELLMEMVSRLADMGITADDLTLEVTDECLVGRGADTAQFVLDGLADQGFDLTLEDFGTGNASLAHLKNLPLTEIKIDRSFVNGVATTPLERSIVAALVEIARGLGLRAMAEGVEHPEQRQILEDLGIELGQGHLWAKPMRADRFAELLSEQDSGASWATGLKETGLRATR